MSGIRYERLDEALSGWDNGAGADMALWRREQGEDNSEQVERLRRNLHRAQRRELTKRQAEMIHLYYDLGLSMSQIAQREQVNKSTVSRTLKRGRERLRKYLQYCL